MNQRKPFWLNSIKYRLVLLFFSITAGAILVIYFYVVPQLESNLISQKVDALKKDASTYSKPLQAAIGRDVTGHELDRLTRRLGEQSGAGVTLLGVPVDERGGGGTSSAPPYVISDSRDVTKLEPSSQNVLDAAQSGSVTTAERSENGQRLAQAAKPLSYRGRPAWVVVFSEPLSDVADNVALIKRQILVAGLIALAAALVSGYYAASALTRRVKRLERAAGQVASGNFSEPIPVDSEDELGQLAQAFNEMQRRLARFDQARKEFIANASHELRTPIFSLGGFAELLADEDVDEETRSEFLTTMREQIDRLQKLATDLLDLSRLDADALDLELVPVPLRSLSRQVAGEFTAAATMHGSSIEVHGDPDDEIEAQCDPARVAQILRILVDNALTHTPEGTIVEVNAEASDGSPNERASAAITVVDNGLGIPRSELPHVFDRFHSGNAAQGSGLGLAIARELAQVMLGSLSVRSRSGSTVFRLSLPLATGSAAGNGRGPEAAPVPAGRVRTPA